MGEEHSATTKPAMQPEPAPEPAPPALPDYVLSPNAVFKDEGAQWRYGRPPDYSKTRRVWEEGRKNQHAAGSLEQLTENLVKNWEVEASFKPRLEDWRTVDPERYTFAMAGGPPQSANHMLKVGTYNAIIAPNEYYDPTNSDFASSHKTFKRMMPTFAWEVMEVYSGPPKVVFKWRHWGEMKNDYVGFNNKGQKVTAKAHGGPIEIFGTTVAVVDDKLRVVSLDTYMDSLDMFRQIAPHGVVNMEPMSRKMALSDALDAEVPNNDGIKIAQAHEQQSASDQAGQGPEAVTGKHLSSSTGQPADAYVPNQGACPFMGSVNTSGMEPPHPIPQKTDSTDDMSVGQASSGDPEFSDAVLVGRGEDLVPETMAPMPTEAQSQAASMHGAHEPVSGAYESVAANEQMQLDNATLDTLENPATRPSITSSAVTGDTTVPLKRPLTPETERTQTVDGVDTLLAQPPEAVHPHPKDVEAAVQPGAGEAVVADAGAEETKAAKAEMSEVRGEEVASVMNRE